MVPYGREREAERGWKTAPSQGEARLQVGNMRLLPAEIQCARGAKEKEA